jgi:hypothetical protein
VIPLAPACYFALLSLAWIAQLGSPIRSAIHYPDIPPSVVLVSTFLWREGAPPLRVSSVPAHIGKPVDLAAAPGERLLVVFARADGAYLVDGPFTAPDHDSHRVLDPAWRWTIRAALANGPARGTPLEWVGAVHDSADGWPRCFWNGPDKWECWGARTDEAGVVLAADPGKIWWTVASSAQAREWRSDEWGRLLIVRGPESSPPDALRFALAQPVTPPAQRFRTLRLNTALMTTITATPIDGGAAWIAGARPAARSWAEIRASGAGPKYLSLEDLSSGPPSLRVSIALERPRRLEGTVSGGGTRARGALVTLFRLIDPVPDPKERVKPRRVFAAESTADEDGAYRFEELADADYEVVAWHPQLGRASVFVPQAREQLQIQLDLPGIVRGRVLVAGKPAGGVDVFSVPDPAAFNNAEDPIDVKGGDGRTAADGRFAVALAAAGGGELRVGGGAYAVRRLPLPSPPVPLVDLGDIELGASLDIAIVLDQDSPCGIRTVGPVGRTGLHVLAAARMGPGLYKVSLPEEGLWEFGLSCGRETRALVPAVVRIGPDSASRELHFSVKQED